MTRPRLERWVAAGLERGHEGPAWRALGALWAQAAAASPGGSLRAGRVLVAVTGATLGGSWKTPVSIALARALAGRGLAVGLLGHGHRARPEGVEEVTATSPLERAGDEALVAARQLAGHGVRVAVGPRLPALRWLERHAEVVVADGLARAIGPGATVVLALDGQAPWGSGRCPPAGDLRAPAGRLLASASDVVAVVDETAPASLPDGWWRARASLTGLDVRAGERVAVVTSVARPERFAAALERRGVAVTTRVALADHGGRWAAAEAERQLRGRAFDRVLCTDKCAPWLPARLGGRAVTAVGVQVALPAGLVDRMAALVLSSREPDC